MHLKINFIEIDIVFFSLVFILKMKENNIFAMQYYGEGTLNDWTYLSH